MGFYNIISLGKRASCYPRQGCQPTRVADYQVPTRMRIRHFNIVGFAWSNFKPGININGHAANSTGISIASPCHVIDVLQTSSLQ
jgi:hypothetical protein